MKDFFYKKLPVFWLISLTLSLIISYSAIESLKSFRHHQNQMLIDRGAALAEFSAANICTTLEGAARQLEMLAKSDVFYGFKKQELLAPFLGEKKQFFELATEAYLFEVGFAYERFLQLKRSLDYWKELPEAFFRRIVFEFSKLGGVQFSEEDPDEFDGFVLPMPKFGKIDSIKFYGQTRFARDMTTLFKTRVSRIFDRLIDWAKMIDGFTKVGHSVLVDQSNADRFLSIAIYDRKWFSGLKVVNRFGFPLVNFSTTGIQPDFDDYKVCRKFSDGTRFWVGPVFNSPENFSYLQMVVPVKDHHRQFCSAIRGAFNLELIRNNLKATQIEKDTEVIVLDRDFTCLLSSSGTRKINQVSFIKNLLPEGFNPVSDSSYAIRNQINNERVFLIPISRFRDKHLPDWKVAVIQKEPVLTIFSLPINEFVLFVLAVAGLNVLFYCALQLIKLFTGYSSL